MTSRRCSEWVCLEEGIGCSAAEEYSDAVDVFVQFSYGIYEEGEILGRLFIGIKYVGKHSQFFL